jgi:sulfite exporter TauE/SafE
MNGALTLGAALLLGFAASGHCLVMCGGISAALGMAAAKDAQGRTRLSLILSYQLGRISSYALAGLLLAGILGGLVSLLDIESVRRTLRALSAFALLLGALVAFGGGVRDPAPASGAGSGQSWRHSAGACCPSARCHAVSRSAWCGAGCPVGSCIPCCSLPPCSSMP